MTVDTKQSPLQRRRRFVAALVADRYLFLRAQADPHTAAHDYGVELSDTEAELISGFDPDALERLRDRLINMESDLPEIESRW